MRKRLLSTIIALLFIASLTSVAAAVDYTLYDGVLNGFQMIGGPTGYYTSYQSAAVNNQRLYTDAIYDGVELWNYTEDETGFSFDYTDESNAAHYNSSKLRFVVGNYGLGFRGETIRYDVNGYDTKVPDLPSYGPRKDWAYAIIRINNQQILDDYNNMESHILSFGVNSTVSHEIGHALGLKHHDAMSASGRPVLMHSEFTVRYIEHSVMGPGDGDIAGVRRIYITGVDSNDRAAASTQTVTLPKQSLADFTAERDRVAVASFRGYGDIVARGNGVINLGGHIMDDTAYYVECLFETEQGEIICALEYIGFGAARSMQHVLPKSGQYLLFLSESMGYSYLVDPELSLQHVVNGEVVWNPAAQAALDLPATRMDVASLTQ